ncbi:MAG: hypothetical protein IPN29_19720 [Saprospiraceae bacterium]|nr:hypothetical protein [Saprospiraceae bacterium]
MTLKIVAMLLCPLAVMAHPGHGDSDGYSIIHYFKEINHLIFPLAAVVALVAIVKFMVKRKTA